ncbi:MAG: peptidylprolyl isomerase [Bacteroidales bacterium]
MAVLEKIRSRMGLLASLIIGFALLAFVLSDFLTGGRSILGNNQFQIAEINGKKVQFQEFDLLVNQLSEVYKFNSGQANLNEDLINNIREQSWQQLVDQYVLGDEYQKIGLSVSPKEVLDMVQGSDPHPYIRQLFTDPKTQIFNRAAVLQFIKSLEKETDPARKNYWLYIENQIIRERYMTKYMNLINKGLYVTSRQVQKEMDDNSRKVSFNYLAVNYSTIPDSLISVKLSEVKKYLKEHAKEFEQEASRDIEYVTFDIVPSAEDFAEVKSWMEKNKDEFFTTDDVKQFVNMNSDVSFSERYLKEDELLDSIKPLYNSKVGDHVGPFFANGIFYMARLIDTKMLPDSVRARHILIRPENNTKEAYDKAKAKADSLLALLKKGANFADLARNNSADGSAQEGGDLGWFKDGQMVKPFNDACFNGKKGQPQVVETQFGFHVVEVTDRGKEVKKVQVAVLQRKVEASTATQQAIYQKASAFAGNNNTGEKFLETLKKEGITPLRATYLTENMREVPGLPNSRELVRWAFTAKPNSISGVMELGDRFVVARLAQVREKGLPDAEQVKDQIAILIRKDKKAQQLMQRLQQEMNATPSLDLLAQKESVKVDTVYDITFASYALPAVGFEPAVIAAATVSPVQKLAGPVKGNTGVFVLQVFAENTQEVSREIVNSRLTNSYLNRANYEPINVLKKLANIKDMRAKFY